MEERSNNGNKVLLTVIGAATLLVAMVGATFAYFSAQGTSTKQEITTGSSNLTITASNNSVTNIKPTTFDTTTLSNNDSNADIVKIDLAVKTSSTSAGTFDITMSEPAITIGNIDGDQGVVADIKYAVYDSTGTQVGSTTSFKGTAADTVIVSDANYAAGNDVTTNYTVYVWIDNKDADQNNLQDISFDVTFTADATTSL